MLVLQHAREGTPGLIAEGLAAGGFAMEVRFPHEGEPLPESPAPYTALVLMGGLMSATDDEACPHFPALLELVRAFPRCGRPVLGVCLGAQLIARAWSARVYRHRETEFGYYPVERTAAAADDPVAGPIPARTHLMQWHEDTFDLPAGATLLLTGEGCRHQALRLGRLVYGFQCHFETTREMVASWSDAWAREGGGDPAPRREHMAAQYRRHGAEAERVGRGIIERWLALVPVRWNTK